MKVVEAMKLVGFVVFSCIAYAGALAVAQWMLGANSFATFGSYASLPAVAALCVSCFVGGCLGAFVIALGLRLFIFRFDLVRGLFLFTLFAAAVGSLVAVGFEFFGFTPQFLFPVWNAGMMGVAWYVRHMSETPEDFRAAMTDSAFAKIS
jgi:hypothetical protein